MKCPRCGYENRDDARFCNLCQTIFKKQTAPPPTPAPPPPGKPRLDYTKIAEDFVAKSGPHDPFIGGFGVILDYSPASLHAIDEFVSFTWGTKGEWPTTDDYKPSSGKSIIIINFGCYFGEVARRLFGGRWEPDPKQPDNPLWANLILKDASRIFPISKAFKRMKNGSEDAMYPMLLHLMRQFKLEDNPTVVNQIADGYLRQADAFLNRSALPAPWRLHFARQFSRVATGLNPKLTSPVLATILEWINKVDPKELEEAMLYPPDIVDFAQETAKIHRGPFSLGIELDYSLPSLAVLDASTAAGEWQAENWPLGCYIGE